MDCRRSIAGMVIGGTALFFTASVVTIGELKTFGYL